MEITVCEGLRRVRMCVCVLFLSFKLQYSRFVLSRKKQNKMEGNRDSKKRSHRRPCVCRKQQPRPRDSKQSGFWIFYRRTQESRPLAHLSALEGGMQTSTSRTHTSVTLQSIQTSRYSVLLN